MNSLIKWPGGKKQLANKIIEILGRNFNNYFEPFLGGGSVLLNIQPQSALCLDSNEELINMYNVVKERPQQLISILYNDFIIKHSKEFFYEIRNIDKNPELFKLLSPEERAARFLYMNKTCYNGLWRVNRKGEFNVPFGRYKSPSFTSKETIIESHRYFKSHDIKFMVSDYLRVENYVKPGDLVYFDPPYDIKDGQNGFVNYTKNGFYKEDQKRLKELCDRLVKAGIKVGISNSDTDFIRNLYSHGEVNYEIHDDLFVNRSIGSKSNSRKKINELLIVGRV